MRGASSVKVGKESAAASVVDSIADAAAHLHGLLQSKEKELKEREADFSRRVTIFESQNPTLGKDTDVIELNVGGNASVAVLRRTLTMFEESSLAAKFSGRWDDSMEKDGDGKFFVDQDPEHFLTLISHLRLRMNNHSLRIPVDDLPKPSYAFCSMLEYYNLMPGVYPQNWVGDQNKFTCEEISYGTVELSSKETDAGGGDGAAVNVSLLHDFGLFDKSGLSEFTAVFQKGATGAIGWMYCLDKGVDSTSTHPLTKPVSNCVYLSIAERKIYGSNSVLEENMMIDNMESATTITCRYEGKGKYAIELAGASPPGGVADMLKERDQVNNSGKYETHRIFPMITFSGKVTVSGLKYALDVWRV